MFSGNNWYSNSTEVTKNSVSFHFFSSIPSKWLANLPHLPTSPLNSSVEGLVMTLSGCSWLLVQPWFLTYSGDLFSMLTWSALSLCPSNGREQFSVTRPAESVTQLKTSSYTSCSEQDRVIIRDAMISHPTVVMQHITAF